MAKSIDDVLYDLIEHWIELRFCIGHDGDSHIIYGQVKSIDSDLLIMGLLTDISETFYLNRTLIEIVSIIDLGSDKPSINEKSRMTI